MSQTFPYPGNVTLKTVRSILKRTTPMTDRQVRNALKSTSITDEMLEHLSGNDQQPTAEAFAEKFSIGRTASKAVLQLWRERKL